MKKFFLFLFIILLFPLMVNAEENKVIVKEISLYDKSDNVVEVSPAVIEDGKVSLDFKMYEVGDFIQYKLKVVNNSREVLEIDRNSISINDKYVNYSLFFQNDDNSINSGEEKDIYLKINYSNKVADGDYFSAKYINQDKIALKITSSSIVNPETIRTILPILLLIEIMIGYSVYSKRKIKYSKVIIFLLCIGLIPFSVSALKEEILIDQKTTIRKIKPTHCTFSGDLTKGVEYTNGQFTYRYMEKITAVEDEQTGQLVPAWKDMDSEGWSVRITDPTSTEDVNTTMCSTINDKPLEATSGMFYSSQTSNIDTSKLDTENVNDMFAMFSFMPNLEGIDASNLDTSKVMNIAGMFTSDSSLQVLDLSTFDTSKVTDMSAMFWDDQYLTNINMSNFDTSNVTNMTTMFSGCYSLTSLDVTNFNTSNVTDMSYMFLGVHTTELDLSNFDTSNVVDFRSMFSGCVNLLNLDLSSFDTSKAADINSMFDNCASLTSLDLSNFDTSNVRDMAFMFCDCSGLVELDLSNFNTSKVEEMGSMFAECSSLVSLNLSNFDTSNVCYMGWMFYNCNSLTTLDLSSFDTANTSYNMYNMFGECTSITTAYGRTQEDCDRFNSSDYKPDNVNFVIKV